MQWLHHRSISASDVPPRVRTSSSVAAQSTSGRRNGFTSPRASRPAPSVFTESATTSRLALFAGRGRSNSTVISGAACAPTQGHPAGLWGPSDHSEAPVQPSIEVDFQCRLDDIRHDRYVGRLDQVSVTDRQTSPLLKSHSHPPYYPAMITVTSAATSSWRTTSMGKTSTEHSLANVHPHALPGRNATSIQRLLFGSRRRDLAVGCVAAVNLATASHQQLCTGGSARKLRALPLPAHRRAPSARRDLFDVVAVLRPFGTRRLPTRASPNTASDKASGLISCRP